MTQGRRIALPVGDGEQTRVVACESRATADPSLGERGQGGREAEQSAFESSGRSSGARRGEHGHLLVLSGGTDAAFDPQNPTQIKIGRRLAIKVLNAAKFVLSFPVPEGAEVTHALDASMLATLDGVIRDATKALEGYDHARALEITESFFWTFCDDYLELVKERAYDRSDVGQASAALALRTALSTLLRLFAPVLAFATEESWSWFNDGSVHTAAWPEPLGIEGDPVVLSAVGEALIGVRRAKTEAKVSQKTPVASVTIATPRAAALRLAEGDLRAVGRIAEITFVDAEATAVDGIVLAPEES